MGRGPANNHLAKGGTFHHSTRASFALAASQTLPDSQPQTSSGRGGDAGTKAHGLLVPAARPWPRGWGEEAPPLGPRSNYLLRKMTRLTLCRPATRARR